jgi:hypothetical protein
MSQIIDAKFRPIRPPIWRRIRLQKNWWIVAAIGGMAAFSSVVNAPKERPHNGFQIIAVDGVPVSDGAAAVRPAQPAAR